MPLRPSDGLSGQLEHREGASESSREENHLIWLGGRYQHLAGRSLVCVNPLNWTLAGTAPARLNLGALPGVRSAAELRAPVPQLTGATCNGAALEVSIPLDQRLGFADALTLLGSYHIFDYNLFYTNIRVNAKQRVVAYHAARVKLNGWPGPQANGIRWGVWYRLTLIGSRLRIAARKCMYV